MAPVTVGLVSSVLLGCRAGSVALDRSHVRRSAQLERLIECSNGLEGAFSRRCCRPGSPHRAQPKHGQARQVGSGRKESEVGVDLGRAPHPGPAPTVLAPHQVGELALDLRPGGPVAASPLGVGLASPGSGQLRLVVADPDAAPPHRGGALGGGGQSPQAVAKRATPSALVANGTKAFDTVEREKYIGGRWGSRASG